MVGGLDEFCDYGGGIGNGLGVRRLDKTVLIFVSFFGWVLVFLRGVGIYGGGEG